MFGYAKVSTRDMLVHLYKKYRKITQTELQTNDENMKEAYDPNAPIEDLIEQIDLAIAYADAGGAPYTVVQTITIAYTLIFNTVMYNNACKEWRKRSASDKTWSKYKTHFMDAHDNLRQTQQTAKVAG